MFYKYQTTCLRKARQSWRITSRVSTRVPIMLPMLPGRGRCWDMNLDPNSPRRGNPWPPQLDLDTPAFGVDDVRVPALTPLRQPSSTSDATGHQLPPPPDAACSRIFGDRRFFFPNGFNPPPHGGHVPTPDHSSEAGDRVRYWPRASGSSGGINRALQPRRLK